MYPQNPQIPPSLPPTDSQTQVLSQASVTYADSKPGKTSRKRLAIITTAVLILLLSVTTALFILWPKPKIVTRNVPKNDSARGISSPAIDVSSLGSAYDSYAAAGLKDLSPDKKAATLDAFRSLSNGFVIAPGFFKDKSTALIGLGIARGSLDHPLNLDGYRNALYLLASNYLDTVPPGITDEYFVSPKNSDLDIPKVFAKYTDQAATDQLKGIMKSSGVEAEAAHNLGIDGTSALAGYTPLVMNFATGSSAQQQFAKEHYMFGANPTMWVEATSTTKYLIMTKDYGTSFIANPSGSERHTVIHELIHTQNAFVRGDLGHAIEERRAELFSGDLSAYYDTKQLFIYTSVFSGFNPIDLLQKSSTDSDNFYIGLYKAMGVEGANAFIVSTPNGFLTQPSSAVNKAQAAFGGMDAVMKVALKLGQTDPLAMTSRLETRNNKLLSVFKTKQKVIDDLNNSLASTYRMPTAAAEMKAYINSH